MRSHSRIGFFLFAPLLLGVTLMPAKAQYLMVQKPQGGLGRELSNPFPISNDIITTASLLNPNGTPYVGAVPSRFVAFQLEVSVQVTDTRTTAGGTIPSDENDDISSMYATLSFGGDTEERTDTSGRLLNYNFNTSGYEFGEANFSSSPIVGSMTTLTAEGAISSGQSDDLIATLTDGQIDFEDAPDGFKPYIGPRSGNGTARYYTYDTSANYRLLLFTSNPVPEPGTVALLGASLLGSGFFLRRRR